jgi:hypothetical protein
MTMANTIHASETYSKKILFIHHSTGGNLISEGKLRDRIKALDPSVQLWDHSYNLSPAFPKLIAKISHLRGLTDNNGNILGIDYDIVLSNNSPKEYAEIFSRNPDDKTLKSILSYDIIAFKNCFPTTQIISDQQLNEDIEYYQSIRESLRKYPNKQFVLLTPPPSRKSVTNLQNAARAKKMVKWLTSADFSKNLPNLHVFDYFTILADKEGYLKQEYERVLPWDSHPNQKANKTVAPQFADYLAKQFTRS